MMTRYMKEMNSNPATIAYKKFMYNRNNVYNCTECPENFTGKYMGCGQQNCWVSVHCDREEER